MTFRPLIPLVKVREGGIFTKLTGVGDLNAPIHRIKNALITGEFPELARIVVAMLALSSPPESKGNRPNGT